MFNSIRQRDPKEKILKDFYVNQSGDYYLAQLNRKGLRGAWFKKRQLMTGMLVSRHWGGGPILDLGCGNCLWNEAGMPVLGMDICDNMLKYNMSSNRSLRALRADISKDLPIKDGSVNTVVITEVLEHFGDYLSLVGELKRILKKGGIVIGSVPYGKFPGLWSPAFALQCLYRGLIHGDQYYLNRCGHAAAFNVHKIRQAFREFDMLDIKALGLLTIFFVAKNK